MRSQTLRNRLTTLGATLLGVLVAGSAQAQHAGDIGLRVDEERLVVFGPLGAGEDTGGVFLATFGDTGFPGYTSNPGFDALAGTLPQGRVGFAFLAGMSRWDAADSTWLEPAEVGERMRVSFITLQTIIEDEPIIGFDLAVQPDGGWHRHVNYELLPDDDNIRLPGVYRLDLMLYSTMGLLESEPFTILFDYNAASADVDAAIDSMYTDAPCLGDLNGDLVVDGGDLATLLGEWGTSGVLADLSLDGLVDGQDLSMILGAWGPCPD